MRHRTVAQANERGGDNGETTPWRARQCRHGRSARPTHIDPSFAPQAIGSRGDIRDVLIAQQVRRIDELERQVDELSRELRKLSAAHGDAGSDPMGAPGETRA